MDRVKNFESWQRGQHVPAHARRSAERNAAFFLNHLEPGMRVLDAGCGPGSITIGLASAVGRSGRVVGIDASLEAISAASELGAETNTLFAIANVYDLPFPTASFDAVFCHALLQHLADPPRALQELRRVLGSGGVIGVANADHDGTIMWPSQPLIDEFGRLLRDLRSRRGEGDPRIGKRLGALLHDAGFRRVKATVSADADGDEESTRRTAAFWANYIRSAELREQVKYLGMATDVELDAMADAWLRWGGSDGAYWARFWCQAVGWVPKDSLV